MAEDMLFRRAFISFLSPVQTKIRRESEADDYYSMYEDIPWWVEYGWIRAQDGCPRMDVRVEKGDEVLDDIGTRQDVRVGKRGIGESPGRS